MLGTQQGFCTPATALRAQQTESSVGPAVALMVKQLSLRGQGWGDHLRNAKPKPRFPETCNSQGAWRLHLPKQVRARKKEGLSLPLS